MNKLDLLIKAGGKTADYIAYIKGEAEFDWEMIAELAGAAEK